MVDRNTLQINVLGDLTLVRGGSAVPLPPSRKARALLAYLVVTGRSHRRERLCNLLWDVADDPRGALRWCLSKLRPLVDDPEQARIVADRETVAFRGNRVEVDLLEVKRLLGEGVEEASTETLSRAAHGFRGEFLEGLELPEYHDFQAWCVAEREEARSLHMRVLDRLLVQMASDPQAALPHAQKRVQVDPMDEGARVRFIHLLRATGREREAEEHLRAGLQLQEDFGTSPRGELAGLEADMRPATPRRRDVSGSPPARDAVPEPPPPYVTTAGRLVGRETECTRLLAAVEAAVSTRQEQIVLVSGEPGVGKTRLLAELMRDIASRGGTVLDGAAYEAETGRPYGPWIDALRRLPAASVGSTLGNDLAPLLPELPREEGPEPNRGRLFGAVVEVVAARAHSAPPVLLVFDDVQWCDETSVSLLHYVTRMSRHRPVVIALAAREGEMPDNEPMLRFLRGLKRGEGMTEIRLGPMKGNDIETLVRQAAPEADATRVVAESGGNPLFALELARSSTKVGEDIPGSLAEAVRDRIDRLSPSATEALRWGAILGRTLGVEQLRELTSLSVGDLIPALEALTRHTLLREATGGAPGSFVFAHDLVRKVVYNDLSSPCRLLMHGRVAAVLGEKEDPDDSLAADLARHAILAGDMETAARACVRAGRRCLRVFANGEAYALAHRGARYAENLPERERVEQLLELAEVRFAARRPEHLDEAAREVEALAARALDLGSPGHARLGFHVVSSLRWEEGSWSDARRHTLRAEEISRSEDSRERVLAMAETARCLALLERDLGQAEALVLEAGAISSRLGLEPSAIALAGGMLHLHRGNLEAASASLLRARELARDREDHVGEFQALESLVLLEMDRGDEKAARQHSRSLLRIGEKVREGSEAPFAETLAAVLDYTGNTRSTQVLDTGLEALRRSDAKHRLAVCLLRAAERDLEGNRAERARARGEEALQAAEALGRPSETAMARLVLVRAGEALGDRESVARHREGLTPEALSGVATRVRRAVESLPAAPSPRRPPSEGA